MLSFKQLKTDFSIFLCVVIEKQKLPPALIVQLTEKLNNSVHDCLVFFAVLTQIFMNSPSKQILFAVELLTTMVKNCNKGFHIKANDSSFQKSVLHLLRRQRGLASMYEKLRSNKQNWTKIQAKILYIVQLWYDAFILEQNTFDNIIANYKLLRKQGITFPPRQQNEKNMLAVHTESPIFDNIQSISAQDQINFTKKKIGLGLVNPIFQKSVIQKQSNVMNLQEVGELIAIIRSLQSETDSTKQAYNKLKRIVRNKIVSEAEKKDSHLLLIEAEKVIQEWDKKYGEGIQNGQEEYMKKKMASMIRSRIKQDKQQEKKQEKQELEKVNNDPIDLLEL